MRLVCKPSENAGANGGDIVTPHPKKYRVFSWIRSRQIGDRFTAQNIADDIGLISQDVSSLLRWQSFVRHAGKVPGRGDTNVWEKIAEVPEVPA